jgi:hypothetical protein
MGHIQHIGEKLRRFEAQWYSGCEGSAVVAAGGEVWIKITGGIVYQMHQQTIPILDTTQYSIDAVSQGSKTFTISGDGDLSSTFPDGRVIAVNDSTGNDGLYTIASTAWSDPDFIITVEEAIPDATADGTIGDDAYVVNHDVTAYTNVADLTDITNDASGSTLTNRSFSIVMWGVANKSGEVSHLMLNLPTSTYTVGSPDDAVSDANNYSVYDIPDQFQGVGYLIARFTFTKSGGGAWSLYDTEDLRGKVPNTTAGGGGGGGGGGASTWLALTDTPGAYTNYANKISRVNSGETGIEFREIAVQREFESAMSLLAGESAVVYDYIDAGDYDITLAGASDLYIVNGGEVETDPVYPAYASVTPETRRVLSGNWTVGNSSNARHSWYLYNSSFADTDSIEFDIFIGAGTYDLEMVGQYNSDQPIIDVYVDGVEVGTVDLYGPGTPFILNEEIQIADNLVIGESGNHIIRVTIDGKNASSSGYALDIGAIYLKRSF